MAHAKKWFAACMTALAGSILLMLVVFWIFDPYFHCLLYTSDAADDSGTV